MKRGVAIKVAGCKASSPLSLSLSLFLSFSLSLYLALSLSLSRCLSLAHTQAHTLGGARRRYQSHWLQGTSAFLSFFGEELVTSCRSEAQVATTASL